MTAHPLDPKWLIGEVEVAERLAGHIADDERLREARFQTIHHYTVDVARGLALVFGIGTEALPEWDAVGRCVSLPAVVFDRDPSLSPSRQSRSLIPTD